MKIKILGLSLLGVFLGICTVLYVCNRIVVKNAEGKTSDSVDNIRSAEVGLLLGTTPQTRVGHRENMFFKYRIDAAEKLYKEGKVKSFLISGDENSLDGVNEPECMRDSLVARGIPGDVIFLDGKGFRTLDSMVRMNKVIGIITYTIISQRFHNERALYLVEHMGLEVKDIKAFNAKEPMSAMSMMTYIREYFARFKMFLDIWTDKQPASLEDEKNLRLQIDMAVFNSINSSLRSVNTIVAHNEQDTIVGNFTGRGVDTLYVEKVWTKSEKTGEPVTYYMSSSNKRIPKIELYGCASVSPKLVNEGDLDGNGTCEVGYVHTWMCSQWRYYRIFTLVGNKWRYLVRGEYLDTPNWFRQSGTEVAEPGKEKGKVLIHYAYDEYDEVNDERVVEIRDTIVRPTFDRIND